MSVLKKLKAVAFGEVLYDVFPDGKKIGGAPLNLALRMQSLGCDAAMISSVGNDADGIAIKEYIKNQGLNTNGIETNQTYPTGLVTVLLDEHRTASYEINYPSAWDKITADSSIKTLVDEADIFIYGSLASRDKISKTTLLELLHTKAYKVFDANLRPPHYTPETVSDLMKAADFIKFNDEEILEISQALGSENSDVKSNIEFIAKLTGVNAICVTRGKDGALLFWEGNFYENKGYTVKVVDTVGAGDSFLATLITNLYTGKAPQYAIDYACAMGALVAASAGANPKIAEETILSLINKD